jgi:O-antigen/teichoic acid export membrane protein
MAVGAAATSAAPPPASSGASSGVGRNLAVLAGSQVVTWSLSLLWTVYVPRALGPHGMGELTIAYAVTGVVSVAAGLGIGTLMVREIARDHAKAPALIGSAVLVRCALILPSIGAVGLYIVISRAGAEQSLVLWLATGGMLVGLFTQPFMSTFQGLERMEYLAYTDVLTKAVASLAGIALVMIGFRVVGISATSLVIATIGLLLAVWWSRGKVAVGWRYDPAQIRFLIVGSLPFWTTGLVLTVYMWIDSVLLSLLSSDVAVGWYAVPTSVFATLMFVPGILSVAMLPRLSAAFGEGVDAMRKAAGPLLELAMMVSVPIAAGTALLAQPFIADVYGPQFGPSTWVLVVLAVMLPPTYFNVLANQVFIASNRQVVWTKVMVVAAVINPLLNLLLIRYFQHEYNNGAIGAALSLLATEIGMALAALCLLPPMFDSETVMRFIKAAAATAGMALVMWPLKRYGLIVDGLAGMFAFACFGVALRLLNPEETALLRGAAARFIDRGARPGKA